LAADGIVGPKTWAAVSSSPAPKPVTFTAPAKTTASPVTRKPIIPPVKTATPTAAAFAPQAEKPPQFAPSPGTKAAPAKKGAARPAVEKTVQASTVSTPFDVSKWPGWAQVLAAVSAVAGIFFVGKRMKKIG